MSYIDTHSFQLFICYFSCASLRIGKLLVKYLVKLFLLSKFPTKKKWVSLAPILRMGTSETALS